MLALNGQRERGLLRVGYTGCSLKVRASWLRDEDGSAGAPRQCQCGEQAKSRVVAWGQTVGQQKKGKERGIGAQVNLPVASTACWPRG